MDFVRSLQERFFSYFSILILGPGVGAATEDGGLSTGVIVAIVVLCVIAVVAAIILIIICCKDRCETTVLL